MIDIPNVRSFKGSSFLKSCAKVGIFGEINKKDRRKNWFTCESFVCHYLRLSQKMDGTEGAFKSAQSLRSGMFIFSIAFRFSPDILLFFNLVAIATPYGNSSGAGHLQEGGVHRHLLHFGLYVMLLHVN